MGASSLRFPQAQQLYRWTQSYIRSAQKGDHAKVRINTIRINQLMLSYGMRADFHLSELGASVEITWKDSSITIY